MLGVFRVSRRWTGTLSFQQGGKRDLLFLVTLVHSLEPEGEVDSTDWCRASLFSLGGDTWEGEESLDWRALYGVSLLEVLSLVDLWMTHCSGGLGMVAWAAWTLALPLFLLLLLFFLSLASLLTFSGALGQKRLTEKPPSVDLAVHCAPHSFKQLCWSWILSERGSPKAQSEA